MMISEFQTHTGIYPDWNLWQAINRAYNESELDQQKFCADYLADVDGLAQRIQRECDDAAARAETELRHKLTDAYHEFSRLKDEVKRLRAQLDRALEWDLSDDTGTQLAQTGYEDRANSDGVRELTDLEAMQLAHRMFGFDMACIKILTEVKTYEVNRYGKLREKDTYIRKPVYFATYMNYIRFNCSGLQWECIDGELYPYED